MKNLLTVFTALLLFSAQLISQWEQSSAGINGGQVFSLFVNDTVIFTGTYNYTAGVANVYFTTNFGDDWKYSDMQNIEVNCFTVKDNIIFAGTEYKGIYLSTNNGLNWVSSSLNNQTIYGLAVAGGYVLAGGGGVFSSSDNGTSWNLVNNTFGVRELKANGNVLYAGGGDGVYVSHDYGVNWDHPLIINLPVEAISYSGNIIFAGSYNGIYRSTNSGLNWNFAGVMGYMIPSMIAKDNYVYTGTSGYGIYRSTNYGQLNSFDQTSLTNGSAYGFGIIGETVFAGFSGMGVFRSTNYGINWVKTEMHNIQTLSLAKNGNNLFAGTNNYGIYYSSNNGTNWFYNTMLYEEINTFLNVGTDLYAGTSDGLYYTSNNGVNWTRKPGSSSDVLSAANGNNLYIATLLNGIFCSSNNGNNWVNLGFADVKTSAILTKDNYVYAGCGLYPTGYSGFVYSTNNGNSFHNSSLNHSVKSLLLADNYIYAGTDSAGIFRSGDNGITWSAQGINNTDINCIIDVNNYLVCGTGRGVYYSSNNGNDWNYLNNGLDSQRVLSLMISGNYLFAGTEANAVWKLDVSGIIGITSISGTIPIQYRLRQNYPNPFNPVTTVVFDIPANSNYKRVLLEVYDVAGKLIQTVFDENAAPGIYEVNVDLKNSASGIYFCVLKSGTFYESMKMVLVK